MAFRTARVTLGEQTQLGEISMPPGEYYLTVSFIDASGIGEVVDWGAIYRIDPPQTVRRLNPNQIIQLVYGNQVYFSAQ